MARLARVLLMGDTHCGHLTGLTPPGWQSPSHRCADFRERTWEWFASTIERYKPFDVVIANGDLIDGDGRKSGASELLHVDRSDQSAMAADVLDAVGCRRVFATYGTAYHTGTVEDWEEHVAKDLRARGYAVTLDGELDVRVAGVTFNLKHHASGSIIPHGLATPILRDALWDVLRSADGLKARADVVVRSHVHRFVRVTTSGVCAMILPCLEGPSKYGRRCTGLTDYGFVVADIHEGKTIQWHDELIPVASERKRTHEVRLSDDLGNKPLPKSLKAAPKSRRAS